MGNTHSAENEHRKLEILRRVDDFPSTIRETISMSHEEDVGTFLAIIEEKLIDLLYGIDGKGLDCERDTEEEIETAVRFFPNILCERYWGDHPPIYAQLAFFKSIPFIPLFAKLGVELNRFQKEERGGLIYREWNVMHSLVNDDYRHWYDRNDEDQLCLVDQKYAAILGALWDMGLFKDIENEGLISKLSHNNQFPEQRFRCLVGLDPWCIYHCQPSIYSRWLPQNDISVFKTILEHGLIHCRNEMGFVFHVDKNDGRTPFDRACYAYGRKKVLKILHNSLVKDKYHDIGVEIDDMTDPLLYAATKSIVHIDAVYFLLRNDPSRYCQAIAKEKRTRGILE